MNKTIDYRRLKLPKIYRRNERDCYLDLIGWMTPMDLKVPVFNLWQGLLDTRVKLPVRDYGMFRLIRDFGIRMMSYGAANGGRFYGPYRSFLVDVNGNTEFYSIGVTRYNTDAKPRYIRTAICVAHDDEKISHHSLQLIVDDNLTVEGDTVSFYHHGRIAVGKMGNGKISELRELVEEHRPDILCEDGFFLGSLKHDRLWRLNDPEVINLIVNLISYSMIRDEYRDYVKTLKAD
ncbi:MAG: hypothetical protein IKF90_17895 [Parasporobacterium sp.]|nr:hypothetical protein [Parasporobacterium sp.]